MDLEECLAYTEDLWDDDFYQYLLCFYSQIKPEGVSLPSGDKDAR